MLKIDKTSALAAEIQRKVLREGFRIRESITSEELAFLINSLEGIKKKLDEISIRPLGKN